MRRLDALTDVLTAATGALAAALAAAAIKAHIPGDREEEHEDNTFGLPEGAPLRRKLRGFFREQLKQVVGHVATIGSPLDAPLPRMDVWNGMMGDTFTPILGVYWDKAGKGLRERIGLDPNDWRVSDPNIHRAIKEQSFKFCSKTNATTDLGIAEARDAVRDQLARGLIGTGQTIPELTKRVQSVFARASKSRAQTIARTESARAIHAAAEMSAQASGVVTAKRWLLSANSCPICVGLAWAVPVAPLGGSFATIGRDPDYSDVRFPPAHPNCRCTVAYEVIELPATRAGHESPRRPEEGPSSGSPAGNPAAPSPPPSHRPGLPARLIGAVARRPRLVAAFVASVPATRAAVRAVRTGQRSKPVFPGGGGGGGKPAPDPPSPTPAPPASPAPSSTPTAPAKPKPPSVVAPAPTLIPPGPIAARIAAYAAGPGKAKLEALAKIDEAHVILQEGMDAAKPRAEALYAKRDAGTETPADKAELDKIIREFQSDLAAYEARVDEIRDEVADILEIEPERAAFLRTKMVTAGRPIPRPIAGAESWLNRVLAGEPSSPGGLHVEYGALKNGRANYRPQYRRIDVNDDQEIRVVCHEMMHAVEHQWPSVGKTSEEFLDYRVGRQRIKKLKDVLPTHGYADWEVGRDDEFSKAFPKDKAWYVGKEYRSKPKDKNSRFATEILSMGVELLQENPARFAKQDPEFCAYVLGVLDGSLR